MEFMLKIKCRALLIFFIVRKRTEHGNAAAFIIFLVCSGSGLEIEASV